MHFHVPGVVIILFLFFCSPRQEQSVDDCFVEYIAGVSLILDPSLGLSLKEKIEQQKQLQEITGVTAGEAAAYLETIKNDPAKGRTLALAIQLKLTEQKDTVSSTLQNKPRSKNGRKRRADSN